MISKFIGKQGLTILFIMFPMLTTDETGCMGIIVWGSILILSILFSSSERRSMDKGNLFAILMWVSAILSSSVSPYSTISNDFYKYLAFAIILILLSNHYYSRNFFYITFVTYSVISLIMAVLIVLSFLGGYVHVDSIFEGQIRYSIGITGIYKNPNYISSFINVAAFIFLNMLFFMKMSFLRKTILFSFIILILFSILLTGTRAAFLTFAIGFLLTLWHHMRVKKQSFVKFAPLFLLILFFYLFFDQLIDYFENRIQGRGGFTDDSRLNSWKWALNLIPESPFIGYGINAWDNLKKFGMLEGLHNIFLEYILNQGFIGLVLLLGLMTFGIRKVKQQDILFIVSFCIITIFPLMFQNGLIDTAFWRVLLMNRILIDYSAYSTKGIMSLFENQWKIARK